MWEKLARSGTWYNRRKQEEDSIIETALQVPLSGQVEAFVSPIQRLHVNRFTPLPHITQIAEFLLQEWGEEYPIHEMRAEFQGAQRGEPLPRIHYAVDLASGKVVATGYVMHQDIDRFPALTPWLSNIYVAASHRRRGLGEWICQGLVQEAQRAGYPCLYLYTDSKTAWYEKMGWKKISEFIHRNRKQDLMCLDFSPAQ